MKLVAVDPVCEMLVEPEGAITQEYDGQTYYFCEPVCRDTFDDEPERWARLSPEREGSIETAVANTAG